jgi:hypothetical protein
MLLLPAGKPQQQTSLAADTCTTSTGRLFITDRTSKHRILLDTGSDLCAFPRKLVPGRKERVNYDLFAANGTTIPTYGWISLSLNLGLRRDFTWRFVVADVQNPIIGADLLAHFGLLVDCRNNRLLDGTTALSAPAQAALMPIAGVKPMSCGTPADDLLAEFPELTVPAEHHARHGTTQCTSGRRQAHR